jgi:putative oxygen-independent coproporphyrinogen III oxidase
MDATDASGLYLHVPFCTERCPFCSFAVTTRSDGQETWLRAVLAEIELRAPTWRHPVDSVFFGGGTPSLLAPATIDEVLRAISDAFDLDPDPEVTLEAHPGNLDRAALEALRAAGVNRISCGAQSFDDEDLRVIGRIHAAADGERLVRDAMSVGIGSVCVDLLYGLPERPRGRWARQIDRAAALGVHHVSAYLLTYEPGTPFRVRQRRGDFPERTQDDEAALFLFTRERLGAAGYEQYEVSNFARSPEHRSRHNRKYWRSTPYLGLGPAAHSFESPLRWRNETTLERYAAALDAGRRPTAHEERLGDDARRLEVLFLGLRTVRGVDLALFGDRSPVDTLIRDGLAILAADRVRLTPEGLAIAEHLAERL